MNHGTKYNLIPFKYRSIVSFDIVIVAHSKDKDTLFLLLDSIKKYVAGVDKIYLIAKENFVGNGVIFIEESWFEFKKNDIVGILSNLQCPKYKHGWYYQQLLKLYASRTIRDLSEYFLVLDADIIFINPVQFFSGNVPYFTSGNGYHQYYFDHMDKLLGLKKQTEYCGISHHMIFNKSILKELFDKTELKHGMPFWQAFLLCLNFDKTSSFCCASEYEIYFNYVMQHNRQFYKIRQLKWEDTYDDEKTIAKKKRNGHIFVCHHNYNIRDDKENIIE